MLYKPYAVTGPLCSFTSAASYENMNSISRPLLNSVYARSAVYLSVNEQIKVRLVYVRNTSDPHYTGPSAKSDSFPPPPPEEAVSTGYEQQSGATLVFKAY